jgi:hypothetical protein
VLPTVPVGTGVESVGVTLPVVVTLVGGVVVAGGAEAGDDARGAGDEGADDPPAVGNADPGPDPVAREGRRDDDTDEAGADPADGRGEGAGRLHAALAASTTAPTTLTRTFIAYSPASLHRM